MILPETLPRGSDGQFTIKQWNDSAKIDPVDLSQYENIIAYLYSSPTDIKKYSRENKEGYNSLIQDSDYEYSGVLTGEINKSMKLGFVIIEIWAKTSGNLKKIVSTIIYNLVDNKIKSES